MKASKNVANTPKCYDKATGATKSNSREYVPSRLYQASAEKRKPNSYDEVTYRQSPRTNDSLAIAGTAGKRSRTASPPLGKYTQCICSMFPSPITTLFAQQELLGTVSNAAEKGLQIEPNHQNTQKGFVRTIDFAPQLVQSIHFSLTASGNIMFPNRVTWVSQPGRLLGDKQSEDKVSISQDRTSRRIEEVIMALACARYLSFLCSFKETRTIER